MLMKLIARKWLERIDELPPVPKEPEDFWAEEKEEPVMPEDYDPPHCSQCGETRMRHPRATVCCHETLCVACARSLIAEQASDNDVFVCPFCAMEYRNLQQRVCSEVLAEFREHNYYSLLVPIPPSWHHRT